MSSSLMQRRQLNNLCKTCTFKENFMTDQSKYLSDVGSSIPMNDNTILKALCY